MTKLTKQEQNLLILALTEGLRDAVVRSYGYISLPTNWQDNVYNGLDSDLSSKLKAKLDLGGLESLIQHFIFTRFFDEDLDLPEKDKSIKLSDYSEFSDSLEIAKEIVKYICIAPYQYSLFTEASKELSLVFNSEKLDIQLGQQLRLVSGKILPAALKRKEFSRSEEFHVRRYNDQFSNIEYNDNDLFFIYRSSGILTNNYSPRLSVDFQDQVRSFYGTCLAAGIFWNFVSPRRTLKPIVAAVKRDGEEFLFSYSEKSDDDVEQASNLYIPKDAIDKISETSDPVATLKPVIDLFKSSESPRLATSSIWLLRANLSNRQLDTVLESSIAIEVLLGDRDASDRIGLSKLMANRCAYSIGKTAEERKRLSDFFLKFYKVRSEIVHTGRYKLTESEQEVVSEGLDLASRLLLHEIKISNSA